jgi:hypothetical protein
MPKTTPRLIHISPELHYCLLERALRLLVTLSIASITVAAHDEMTSRKHQPHMA